jgi:hypothetical protein
MVWYRTGTGIIKALRCIVPGRAGIGMNEVEVEDGIFIFARFSHTHFRANVIECVYSGALVVACYDTPTLVEHTYSTNWNSRTIS